MRALSIVFLLTMGPFAWAASLSCEVTKALNAPQLASNENFWSEVGELGAKGNCSNEKVSALLSKYGVKIDDRKTTVAAIRPPAAEPWPAYSLTPKAAKDVEKLQGHLRAKFNEFLEQIGSGPGSMKNLVNQPGRWGLEKLVQGFGRNAYSIRLNSGYRVAFRLDEEGRYEIFDVTKSTTHNN